MREPVIYRDSVSVRVGRTRIVPVGVWYFLVVLVGLAGMGWDGMGRGGGVVLVVLVARAERVWRHEGRGVGRKIWEIWRRNHENG